ncbi:MAG: AraC family transcriptional regulator ligand-binding domain-containing protein [Tateyamaria sp.]|nr:AraC family transcriptional regulator ligand-binding domain-containing protein [Tateyamaria sp.]MDG2056545.1 AraC family transcriptional regulator ligand-binding domain-containing protein [Tateyamaria sp.]
MQEERRYELGRILEPATKRMGISIESVLRRAGLSERFFEQDDPSVDAKTYFDIWRAFAAELGGPDAWLAMALKFQAVPLVPPLMSLAASKDVISGLERVALFKPLCSPVKLVLAETKTSLTISLEALGVRDTSLPFFYSYYEIAVYLHIIRTLTGQHVRPLKVLLPDLTSITPQYRKFIDGPIHVAPRSALVISKQDSQLPMLSRDVEICKLIEAELTSRLSRLDQNALTAQQTRAMIVDSLPAGVISIKEISSRLSLSVRSLQRKLSAEGTTFQAILDDTRANLAQVYLNDGLSAEEISYLLAYRDPGSFYRAFYEWTGMSVVDARALALKKTTA